MSRIFIVRRLRSMAGTAMIFIFHFYFIGGRQMS
jgi:hypothetical protein